VCIRFLGRQKTRLAGDGQAVAPREENQEKTPSALRAPPPQARGRRKRQNLERTRSDFFAQGHQQVGEGVVIDEGLALFDHFVESWGELFEVGDGVVFTQGEVDGDRVGVGFVGLLAFGSGFDLEVDF